MEEQRSDGRSLPQSGYDVDRKKFESRKRRDKVPAVEFSGGRPHEPYARALLGYARHLIDNSPSSLDLSLAVVVCHMACELVTEQVLTALLGDMDNRYWVTDFLNGCKRKGETICKRYTALTGDEIQNQPFWQKFQESRIRRNGIVHRGQIAQRVEAEDSLDAATALIAHLEEVQERLRTP